MICKLTAHLYTFAFASGLNIGDLSEPDLTPTLAEIAGQDLPDLPEMEWEPDSSICHSWVSF